MYTIRWFIKINWGHQGQALDLRWLLHRAYTDGHKKGQRLAKIQKRRLQLPS